MKGKVYLIGAGPGKPDLITVRGQNILKQAEVVIYDYLLDTAVLEVVPPKAKLVLEKENIRTRLMVKYALLGKKVVRLKNGDPSIFGRLSEEVGALVKNRIEFEVVPGVTAGCAAGAYSGIPLTDREFSSSVIFITGHENPQKSKSSINWEKMSNAGTLVLYMAVGNLSSIVKKLIRGGFLPKSPAAVIQGAGSARQKSVFGCLEDIVEKVKESKIEAPAIVIIGEVAKLNNKFDWFMKNKRILFTGLSDERFFLKGTYFHLPLIKIEPLDNYQEFDVKIKDKYDWIIFASRYGVEYFFKRFMALGFDGRRLCRIKIGAVGLSTANKLEEFGIKADFVPKVESSKGLLKEIKRFDLRGKRIFMPRSDLADKGLTQGLERLGAVVTAAVAYHNVMPDNLPDLDLHFFDEILFTSPSTVRNFRKRYGKVPKGVKVRWIGEVTKAELDKQSLLIKHS